MSARKPKPDLIDRRQRLAAALLLSAFDLPAPADASARQLIEAAGVCPGVSVDEMSIGAPLTALHRARALIDAVLAQRGQS